MSTPPPLVEMMSRDLDRGHLEIEELVPEVTGNPELRQPGPRLLGEVIGHLEVNIVWWKGFFTRPAFVDDLQELSRNVNAPAVVPAILEPLSQFLAGVLVHTIAQYTRRSASTLAD